MKPTGHCHLCLSIAKMKPTFKVKVQNKFHCWRKNRREIENFQIDTDNDGVIDFEEFLQMMTKQKQGGSHDVRTDLQQAFEV